MLLIAPAVGLSGSQLRGPLIPTSRGSLKAASSRRGRAFVRDVEEAFALRDVAILMQTCVTGFVMRSGDSVNKAGWGPLLVAHRQARRGGQTPGEKRHRCTVI